MLQKLKVALILGLVLSFMMGAVGVHAQRATPTPRPRPDQTDDPTAADKLPGTIMGSVYQDVNSDGVCYNTGVAGEGPIANVTVQFVNSDGGIVIDQYSDPNGNFGLYQAGQSYWKLTALPSAEWRVTSQNPLYAPLDEDNRAVTGLVFCVQKASTYRAPTTGSVLLPVAGAPAQTTTTGTPLNLLAFVGLAFIAIGWGLRLRQNRNSA